MTNITSLLVHPGEILRKEYLEPLNMSAGRLAKLLGVPRTRIERIASEQTSISTDTAFRLAKIYQTTPEFWMSMQTSHDLKLAKNQVDVSQIEVLGNLIA